MQLLDHVVEFVMRVADREEFSSSFHCLFMELGILEWKAQAQISCDGHYAFVHLVGPHNEQAVNVIKAWIKDAPILTHLAPL